MEVTIYLAGEDETMAISGMPFDSYESAKSYADDNEGLNVYSVTAKIDFATIQEVE
jgi:hypothetical protein